MLCRVMRVHPWWLSRVHLYYNDETLRTGGKNLECGDLSPLLPLWRLVAKAGPRSAARESWAPSCIRRRQVACGKRGQVRALQSDCGFAAPGETRGRDLVLAAYREAIAQRYRFFSYGDAMLIL